MKRLTILVALALSLVCAGFSVYSVVLEAAALHRFPERSIEEYDRIASGNANIGLSSYSKKQIMRSCYYGLSSKLSLARPRDLLREFAIQCRKMAEATTTTMPTNSFAWFILAASSGALDDRGAMNGALVRSQNAAPHEQWLCELRVRLAEDNFEKLDRAARQAHDNDLLLLAESYRGIRTIAIFYVNKAEFRERITLIVSKLPPDIQRRFVYHVRKAIGELAR